jgi:HPt (histidine-containing phosphotransfer) domain-containing protein
MDGANATRHIRTLSGAIAQVPIIALTADAIAEHRSGFLAAGANAVVVKPVVWRELAEVIDALVSGAALTHQLEHTARPGSGRRDDGEPHVESLDELPALDETVLDDLASALGGPAVADMLPTFVANMVEYRDRLATAIANADMDEVKRAAHAMKGLAAQFGAPRVSLLARQIEHDCRTIADVSVVLGKVVAAVAATAQAIKARERTDVVRKSA